MATDVVGPVMAGPGIRSWEFARGLSGANEVTLAAPPPLPPGEDRLQVIEAARGAVQAAAARADVLVMQPSALALFPGLLEVRAAKVLDLYDPALVEGLELHAEEPERVAWRQNREDLDALTAALAAGDFFLCSSERQRLYWLGALTAAGRVNPLTRAGDPELRRLLAVAPFGLPQEPPRRGGAGLRGTIAGIGADDRVALWAGGIWNWFDPQTLVRATARAAAELPSLRVVFMGGKHPNPSVPRMRAAQEAAELARSLGVEGKHVFFQSGWVPYAERAGLLLDADAGVVLHRAGVESALALRTRVLDHLWTGLPTLITEGDAMADLVAAEGLGLVVPPEDEGAVAAALLKLMEDRELVEGCRAAVKRTAERFRWPGVMQPLTDFCADPRPSADQGRGAGAVTTAQRPRRGPDPARAWRVLRREGLRAFASRSYRDLRRLAG